VEREVSSLRSNVNLQQASLAAKLESANEQTEKLEAANGKLRKTLIDLRAAKTKECGRLEQKIVDLRQELDQASQYR
jgi:hypothetical protein